VYFRTRSIQSFVLCGVFLLSGAFANNAQTLMKPAEAGEPINLFPPDLAALESGEVRRDLPCTVTARKPDLGFDLRFHAGYDLTLPLRELAGSGDSLTVLFRVRSLDSPANAAYFIQRFSVPEIEEEAKGDAVLAGVVDVGEGRYHVDWLMRDRNEHLCTSNWDFGTELSPKEKGMPLVLKTNQIAQSITEPFAQDPDARALEQKDPGLELKLLVNFAPQVQGSSTLQRSDTEALISILKTVQRDPHVRRVSLVAFNMDQSKVVYRQNASDGIDFPALGKALQNVQLGTVNVQALSDPHAQTVFLEQLIQTEVGTAAQPDAFIFAGPKAMLNADVPQEDLRRIGTVECPVFYLNYNLNPQAVPWKDSISHAVRVFRGTEYTISRPRDLWVSTTEMVGRIVRSKGDRQATHTAALPAMVQTGLH
jgi:hypothetical protein